MKLSHNQQLVRILVKGGVLTPQYLKDILAIARQAGNKHIHFGSRQDLLFALPRRRSQATLDGLAALKIGYSIHDVDAVSQQNVVSSYAAADLLPATAWLTAGDYLRILDEIVECHYLRINIADPRQNLVPLFYGNLNFVAAPVKNYWYLYLRLPEGYELVRWPHLVESGDIAQLAASIEAYYSAAIELNIPQMIEDIDSARQYRYRAINEPLQLGQNLPVEYEGFGRMYASDKHWAGFFWRNNQYSIAFLEEICALCQRTGIPKLSITPWKSFIVKDIEESCLVQWHLLLGRYGITMRHSVLELNWHLPLLDASALKLKQHLVKALDKTDVCVFGLSFGVAKNNELPFCSIIIREKSLLRLPFIGGLFKRYDLLYARDFNPNTCHYITDVAGFPLAAIPDALAALCRSYYVGLYVSQEKKAASAPEMKSRQPEHRCSSCRTSYKPEFGDPLRGIPAGMAFAALPDAYLCPVCDGPKSAFAEH